MPANALDTIKKGEGKKKKKKVHYHWGWVVREKCDRVKGIHDRFTCIPTSIQIKWGVIIRQSFITEGGIGKWGQVVARTSTESLIHKYCPTKTA